MRNGTYLQQIMTNTGPQFRSAVSVHGVYQTAKAALRMGPALVEILEQQGRQFEEESAGATRIKQYLRNDTYLQIVLQRRGLGVR